MSAEPTTLNSCGCCKGLDEVPSVHNDPGLMTLRYRIDTQAGFYQRMLQSLPLARNDPENPDSGRPLERLVTRSSDDPTVAFLDAAACVGDVLGFYQERIANEGFLRTATERRSVLELARAIGYELKPGVSASVHLAFTIEDAPGAPGICTLPQGMAVQSVPPQGKLPQIFETSTEFVARATWNSLRPRQTRPADMAVLDIPAAGTSPARKALVLLGPVGTFPAGTQGLHKNLQSLDLFRLDTALPADPTVDALEVARVFFSEQASGIAGGDLLLFVGQKGQSRTTLILRVTEVVAEPSLRCIRIDVEPLPDPVADPAPPPRKTWIVPYLIKPVTTFAKPKVGAVGFNQSSLANTVVSNAWRESDLQAMIGIQGWHALTLEKAIGGAQPSGPPLDPQVGAFAFRAKLGFFGNNAPKWKLLPPDISSTNGDAYPNGWDDGDDGVPAASSRTIWEDSQGTSIKPFSYLERAVPNVTRSSWMVIDAPDTAAEVYSVLDARESSRADFGLSGRAMRVRLANAAGGALPSTPPAFKFRTSTSHVASYQLTLSELPIERAVEATEVQIELDRMVLGLVAGQPVAFVGERSDLPGVRAAEIAVLKDIIHLESRSTLVLEQGLTYSYQRSSLYINANVVHATHGESVTEVLGSGDATIANQRFVLKKSPTTQLSAAGGTRNTLEVRVAGVLWTQVASLYGQPPDATAYTTRIDDDARMQVIFGDGIFGARLPTGTLNVSARYRVGVGPDGEVAADTLTMPRAMPLGMRSVTNPVAASGAEGPEVLADARANSPLTLLTFERVVSISDFADYGRAFPGIGKARADVLSVDGASRVFLTVASATGGLPGSDVLKNLIKSIHDASDTSVIFDVGAYRQRYFSVKARISVDPRYVTEDVFAAVSATLLERFGFATRDLAQSVTAAEVIKVIHEVPGVVALDLEELLPYTDEPIPAGAPAPAVAAFGARWDPVSRKALPADLLLINPVGIVLEEMPA